ncbi:MAG: hypothetical protein LBQ71_01435 [Hungatella sp.]|jgi:hypothetical protein|nr:hypothetical protein [Hungatella sp.]
MRKDLRLPDSSTHLKLIEKISQILLNWGYPCSCQESSIILACWLQKNNISCSIIAGDYEDPVIGMDSIHFWVETEDLIIDGSAVQFLLPDYKRQYTYLELTENYDLSKCKMIYEKNDKRYKHKVDSYIPNIIFGVIQLCVQEAPNEYLLFMDYVINVIFAYKDSIIEELKYMMFSSLCKNNRIYYGRDYDGFIEKCKSANAEYGIKYIKEY